MRRAAASHPGQRGSKGYVRPAAITVSGVTLRNVASDGLVTLGCALQAAVSASASAVARMTFLPGLRRSISRILSRVRRAGLRGV